MNPELQVFLQDMVAARALMSYYGWLKNSDSYILFRKYFYNIKQMKGVIYENSIKSIA